MQSNSILDNKTLLKQCIKVYKQGGTRAEVAKLIREKTGLKRTASFSWAKVIWDNEFDEENDSEDLPPEDLPPEEVEEQFVEVSEKELEFSNKYIFNKQNKKYVFLLESKIGKNLVLSEDKVKGIIKSYSNFKGDQSSINEVAIKFDIPRKFVIEILRCLEVTHDSIPITNEDISERESDELVEEILQEKRFALHQKLEKKDWVETKNQAEKWREFEAGILNPLENYLEGLDFKPLPKFTPTSRGTSNDSIVVGCFDWQIGSSADGRFLFFGEEWSTNKALEAVEKFSEKVVDKASKNGISKATVIFGGDIFHGLNGETAKLTQLKCDTIRYDQFDATVKAVSGLIQRFAEYFDEVECKSVNGNHEGWTTYPVFRLIEEMFSNSSHVNFEINKKEFIHFRVNNSAFLVHHGAAADYKYKVPNDTKGRSALALKCFKIAEREGDYEGVKRRFFIKGDTHSFQCEDLGSDIMFYTFGCLPTGDEYANALALDSTPTQNALIISDGKDFDTLHITF